MVHFSSRLKWDLPRNRLSEAIAARRARHAPIFDLTQSNPTRAGLAYPEQLILSGFQNLQTLIYEPDPLGLLETRRFVAEFHGVETDRVMLTASTSEAYAYLFKLLCDVGDEILSPAPSYPLFDYLAALESIRVVPYPLVYYGTWEMDLESLEASITSRTRAVVLVNPNNPTGSFLKRTEWEALTGLCERHSLPIICDEVFAGYGITEDSNRVTSLIGDERVLTFSLSGLSKAAGMPQMKLGWIVISGPEPMRTAAMERLELIADTYLSVNTPVQHALPALLEAGASVRQQIRDRITRNLSALRQTIGGGSVGSVLRVEGGWYATVQVPRTLSEEERVLRLLEQSGTLVQPGYFFDFEKEAFLVISLLTEESTFDSGVESLAGLA